MLDVCSSRLSAQTTFVNSSNSLQCGVRSLPGLWSKQQVASPDANHPTVCSRNHLSDQHLTSKLVYRVQCCTETLQSVFKV